MLSLVLAMGMLVWGVRSYFRLESIGKVIDVVEEHDELEREWFAYSTCGRLYVASNWTQYHYDKADPLSKTHRNWIYQSGPANSTWPGPANVPRNRVTANVRDRSRGFDVRIISMGHRTMNWSSGTLWTNFSTWAIRLPHWMVALVLLILPAIAWRRTMKARKRRKRIEGGRCIHCGYDLRESFESCPECGKPIAAEGVKVSS